MALEKDAYTDVWLFKPSVFGCNVNSFSLTGVVLSPFG